MAPSTVLSTNSLSRSSRILKIAAGLWLLTAIAGQLSFAAYIVLFYGRAAAGGTFDRWNEVLVGGYVAGAPLGNVVLAAHLVLAIVITVGGPLQLIPQLRARAPRFHRVTGRIYLMTALAITIAGIYMVWTRGTAGGISLRLGITLNGALILVGAAMAWRHVRVRSYDLHRRWALRTYVLASGVWFFRIGLMLWMLINRGPTGIGSDFDGPFVRIWSFGCYLVPLALLELYLRARDHAGPIGTLGLACGLIVATIATAVGVLGATLLMWMPHITG